MGKIIKYRIGDIPKEKLYGPMSFIGKHSTVLIYEGQQFGSGTFIKSGNHYGILTAHHVIYGDVRFDFNPNSSDRLCLCITEHIHNFFIDMQYLYPYHIGVPQNEKAGPDMVFLDILDQSKLSTIKELRLFWDISEIDYSIMFKKNSPDMNFIWVVSGQPKEMVNDLNGGSFDRVLDLNFTSFFCGIEHRYNKGKFDYYETVSDDRSKDPIPGSFVGISGGGLWRIPVTAKKEISDIEFGDPVLSGLQFMQSPLENHKRKLTCHGPKSIYSVLAKKLEQFD